MRLRLITVVIGFATAALPAGTAAQNAAGPVRVVVEYIAGANLYLTGGPDLELAPGDTIQASRGDRTGNLRVVGSGNGRTVVAFVGTPFPVTVGDSLDLQTSSRPSGTRLAADDTIESPPVVIVPPAVSPERNTGGAGRAGSRPARPVRIDGTLALEFDATTSAARWGDEPDERSERRYATPGMRLSATVSDLPGGFRASANLRYERRYGDGPAYGGQSSFRLYGASISRNWSSVRVEAGRFHNPVDLYGGYWDGAMIRVGGRRLGFGASAGYTPDRVSGGFRTVAPKSSVFADLSAGGGVASYRAGIAAHQERDTTGSTKRWLSTNQQLRVGRAILTNRVRLDAADGWSGWSVELLDVNAIVPVVGHLRARVGFARRSWAWPGLEPDTARPHNSRRGAGLQYAGDNVNLAVDARTVQWSDGDRARTISASLSVQRTLFDLGFGLTASRSDGEAGRSAWISPWLSRRFGPVYTMLSFQLYRTGERADADSEGGSFTMSFPLAGGFHSNLRVQTRQGAGSSSNRIFTSLWKSF